MEDVLGEPIPPRYKLQRLVKFAKTALNNLSEFKNDSFVKKLKQNSTKIKKHQKEIEEFFCNNFFKIVLQL